MFGEILGIAAPIIGGLLGGKSATGSAGTPSMQSPTYKLGDDKYANALYEALMGALSRPVANVSYGGLSKPLYDTTKINTMNSLLQRLLGVSSTTGGTPAESGFLGDAALMSGLNPQMLNKLLGGMGGGSTSGIPAGTIGGYSPPSYYDF